MRQVYQRAIAKNSLALATSTGASGGWFVSGRSFAAVNSSCIFHSSTSNGASDSVEKSQPSEACLSLVAMESVVVAVVPPLY